MAETQDSSSSKSASSTSSENSRDSSLQTPNVPVIDTDSSEQHITQVNSTDSAVWSTSDTNAPHSSRTPSHKVVRSASASSETSATESSTFLDDSQSRSPQTLATSNQSPDHLVCPNHPDVEDKLPPLSDNGNRFFSPLNLHPVADTSVPNDDVTALNSKNGSASVRRPVKERPDEQKEPESEVISTPLSIRERILNFEKFGDNHLFSNKQSPHSGKEKADPVKKSTDVAALSNTALQNDPTVELPFPHAQEVGEENKEGLSFAEDPQHAATSPPENGGEDQASPNHISGETQEPIIKPPPPLLLPAISSSSDQHKEYDGYTPKTVADFVVQSAKEAACEPLDISTLVPDAPDSVDSRTRCPIAIPAIVIFVAIGIVLIPFAVSPAICRLGVCGKIDRSSVSTSKYLFRTFEFSAPLGFLLIPTTIQLFCLAFLFVLFRLLVRWPVPVPPLATMSAHIHYAVFKSYFHIVTAIGIISVPVFLLSGFSSSWRTAAAFIFGVIPTVVSPYIALVTTTRATSRLAANFSESIFESYAHVARAAAVVPLTSLSMTFFSLILCYNAVRDVRALVGFILGTALPNLVIRINVAVFANFPRPSSSSRFHPDDVRNPAAPLPSAAAHLTCIAGSAAHLCATFATPLVASAILASSLPYFEGNPLAMCVQNHLDIDRVCVAYSSLKVKFSIAIGLCRLGEFYDEYPYLTDRESVGSLIASPFILAVSSTTFALGVAISSLRVPTDPRGRVNLSEAEINSTTRRRLIPFLWPFLKNTFISALMTLLVTGILVLLSVGPISPFYRANNVATERYVLPETLNITHRCTPRDSPEIGLYSSEFPRLRIENGPYRPISGSGERLPATNEFAWRIFVCTASGLLSGMLISTASGVVSSSSHRGARKAAAVADDGLGSDVIAGIGIGSITGAMAATVITFLTLLCYHLSGGFGVGICAIGITYAVSMTGVTDIIALITKESLRLSAMCGATEEVLRGMRLLCAVGESLQGCGRSVSTAGSVMGTIALLWVLIQNTGIVPSPREIIDDEISVFTRHITDVDRVNLVDRGILPATIFGLMLPFLLCTTLVLVASRVSRVIGRAVRNEMLKRGPWERGEHGDYHRCVRVNLSVALVESMVVVSVAMIGTIVGGLCFGRKGWIAMAVGAIASGSILSLCAVVAGARVEGMRLFRLKLSVKNGDETKLKSNSTRTWTWEEMGAEWVSGCVTALLLFITSSGTVVARVIPPDGRLWWAGFIIAGVWVILMVATSAIVEYVEKEADFLPDDVIGEDQYDVRVNRDVQSPFYEEGARIDRSIMNRQSVLRHVETGDPEQLDPLSA